MRPGPPHHPVEVPPGYPRAFERELQLSDGRTALIRPIVPEDCERLAHAIRTADQDTVQRRFLGTPPHITPALLTHLCTVDYRKRFALVAWDPLTAAGTAIARYEPTVEGTAEVAVAVDPSWRRVGLATALIEMLAEAALDRGIHAFSAYYLAENQPVSALLALAGSGGRQTIKEGFTEASVALDRTSVKAAIQRLKPEHCSRVRCRSGAAADPAEAVPSGGEGQAEATAEPPRRAE
ncbi:GNAT family N-acetyltransferase [Actinoplanes sp. NPDC049118]|uniref:GNAT family N-acetyltransferase n=1 Tax=Actinoplanes sp. NPDC049118 TaxID=3155769 RepID=UPI0033C2FD18